MPDNSTITDYDDMFDLLDKLRLRKLTGGDAQYEIEMHTSTCTKEQQKILRMILDKDLKCGLGVSSVNEVFENLIFTFEVQLADKLNGEYDKIHFPVLADPKLDGMRNISMIKSKDEPFDGFSHNYDVNYISRNGKPFLNFGMFSDELKVLANGQNIVFDGEATGLSNEAAFKSITQQARRKSNVDAANQLVYHIFDWVSYSDFMSQSCALVQKERSDRLVKMFEEHDFKYLKLVRGKICNNIQEVEDYYKECLELGYEGIILKDLTGLYEFKRTRSWLKVKPTDTADLPIVAVNEGAPRTKYEGMLGSITVEREGVQINVGGGFKDRQRKEFWAIKEDLIGKIAEVKYDIVTEDGSFRFPRFVQIRYDK